MIRILHVIDHLGLGGAQTALLNLLKFSDRKNFTHTVASLHGLGECAAEFQAIDVRVISLSPRRWPPLYLPTLWRLLGNERFDIVHCHLFASNWIAKPMAWLRGCRTRFSHDQCNDALRAENSFFLALDKLTNRLSSKILAVSRSTEDFLRTRENIPADRVVYFPNGVDVRKFPRPTKEEQKTARAHFGLSPEALIVGGAGRLAPQKDFSTFLRAAALLSASRPTLHFVLFGAGPEEAEVKKLAAELNLEGRVTFAGYTAERAMIYQAIDVFFLTSLYEGTPMVLLEAMAARIPIAASSVDGTAEILEDRVSARLFPAGKAEAAAEALGELVDDVSTRSRLAETAYARVASNYDAQMLTERMEQFYVEETQKSASKRA